LTSSDQQRDEVRTWLRTRKKQLQRKPDVQAVCAQARAPGLSLEADLEQAMQVRSRTMTPETIWARGQCERVENWTHSHPHLSLIHSHLEPRYLGDALIMVSAEYNPGYAAALKNAWTTSSPQLANMPVASSGTRMPGGRPCG
jgi:hypothetical protein